MTNRQLPTNGWNFVETIDLAVSLVDRRTEIHCEKCNQLLRFVHRLSHSIMTAELYVCCCCANELADHDVEQKEHAARKRSAKMREFVNRSRWTMSSYGYWYREYDGVLLAVYQSNDGDWRHGMKKSGDASVFARSSSVSRDEAMANALYWFTTLGVSHL